MPSAAPSPFCGSTPAEPGYYCDGSSTCELKESCPPGTENPNNGASSLADCTACADGYYAPSSGTVHCTACPAGFDCGDKITPIQCETGTYSHKLQLNCTTCEPGKYQTNTAQSTCIDCPVSYDCSDPKTPPEKCLAGFSCNGGISTPCVAGKFSLAEEYDCTDCPSGTFSASNAGSCTPCPASTYANFLLGATACNNCAAGTYSLGGTTNCTICPAGMACPSTSGTSITTCPAGYYSSLQSVSCSACSPGFYCPHTDSPTKLPCPLGTYTVLPSSSCIPCDPGFKCPSTDSDAAIPCVLGTYSLGSQHQCTDCPAGVSCSSTTSLAASTCSPGYYSLQGEAICTICPRGSYCPQPTDAPLVCPLGEYSLEGAISCTPCEPGFSCSQPHLVPALCPEGYYSPGSATICSECTPGYTCELGSTNPTPTPCPIGGYCNPSRIFTKCPTGTYGNTTGGTSQEDACTITEPGYYTPAAGSTFKSRIPCPQGAFCEAGSSYYSNCPGGTYSDLLKATNISACLETQRGYYTTHGSSSLHVTACPAGYYCPQRTSVYSNTPCPAGTFSGATGLYSSTQCQNCTIGNFCPQAAISPTQCNIGRYNPHERGTESSICGLCERGWACPVAGMFEMTTRCQPGCYCPSGTSYSHQYPCPLGRYSDEINLTSADECLLCPERFACTSTVGTISATIVSCAPGHYCPTGTPSTTSFDCSPGRYSSRDDLKEDDECTICDQGTYCSGGSSTTSGPCQAGHYCPPGTKFPNEFPCPAGKYSPSTSNVQLSDCLNTPPGSYSPSGSANYYDCPAGKYSSVNNTETSGIAGGSSSTFPACTACTAGSYCPANSATPMDCGVGFSSDKNQGNCDTCAVGHYCASPNSVTSIMLVNGGSWSNNHHLFGRCFNGTYCPSGHSTVPTLAADACPDGHYCPTATVTPSECPAGTYQPFTGQDDLADCIPSPPGKYSLQGINAISGDCSPGHYCPEKSTSPTQIPCPERYYRTNSGAGGEDDCAVCVAGNYCPEGSSVGLPCPRGYYCGTGTHVPEPCPIATFGNSTSLRRIEDCSLCSAGMFCDGMGLSRPRAPCDPGYYCLEGSYTSAPHAPGSPTVAEPSPIGGLCPAGGYCPIGSSKPSSCPPGTYNNFTGAISAADCQACDPGMYCAGSNQPIPTGMCEPGYYCTGNSDTPTQHLTPPGYYTTVGSAAPIPCSPGRYNPEYGVDECPSCLAGHYCVNQSSIVLTPCIPGHYCPLNTINPLRCPKGTFSNSKFNRNITDCTQCTPSMYCHTNGLTAPTGLCDANYYCPGGQFLASSAEYECTAGHYCPHGTANPIPCPASTYSPSRGNNNVTQCLPCPGGVVCNSTGLAMPSFPSAEGYYCGEGCSTSTPLGNYDDSDVNGICPSGHSCPEGSSVPIKCPPGFFVNHTGAASCYPCLESYYCDGISTDRYFECPQGSYCPPQTTLSIPKCPKGTFGSTTKLRSEDQCTDCTAGKFCSIGGLSAPDGDCEEGYVCEPSSENAFGRGPAHFPDNPCPSGHYCPASSSNPVPCSPTTYNPSTHSVDSSACLYCEQGKFCSTFGLSSPSGLCASGYTCKHGSDSATPTTITTVVDPITFYVWELGGEITPPGFYSSNGSHSYSACNPGFFNPYSGMGSCYPTPAGYYTLMNSTSYVQNLGSPGYYYPPKTQYRTQYPCPQGTFSANSGNQNISACIDAPPGHYAEGEHNFAITGQCDEGYYCTGRSFSATPTCIPDPVTGECETGGPCQPSEYCPVGSTYAQDCPGGYYCADSSGQITGPINEGYYGLRKMMTPSPVNVLDPATNLLIGSICPPGHFCEEASVSPQSCPPATYSNSTGNTKLSDCKLCSAGFVCPNNGTEVPQILCPPGFVCPPGTATATDRCQPGYMCPQQSGEMTPCAAGSYQDEYEQSTCKLCPAGGYCEYNVANFAVCEPAFYCLSESNAMIPCPAGSYQDEYGQSSCKPCPEGSFCRYNVVNRTRCSPGFYCPSGSSDMIPCDEGYYQDQYEQSTCKVCPAGYYCLHNVYRPITCPAGSFCPPGTKHPHEFLCPISTFSNRTGLNSATDCTPSLPGTASVYRGLTEPSHLCGEGHWCGTGSHLVYPGHFDPLFDLYEREIQSLEVSANFASDLVGVEISFSYTQNDGTVLTTESIPYSSDASTVEDALEALGAGLDVSVSSVRTGELDDSGRSVWEWEVRFESNNIDNSNNCISHSLLVINSVHNWDTYQYLSSRIRLPCIDEIDELLVIKEYDPSNIGGKFFHLEGFQH